MTDQKPIEIAASALEKVDHQLANLEESISKLKKALRHWQSWEIEYEGLREEISSLPDDSSADDMLVVARDFRAESLDDKEIRSLIGNGRQRLSQVVSRLSNRTEYVTRNINTIKRQLNEAQHKRNALLLVENAEHRDEAALPLTEITEELDENGDVISSSVKTANSTAPQIVEVLHKAGVNDVQISNGVVTSTKDDQKPQDIGELRQGEKKSAKDDPKSNSEREAPEASRAATACKDLNRDSSPDSETSSPRVPSDEPPEDAKLRQEMIEYSRGEIGAIVAELELEEDGQDNDSDASIHDFMDEVDTNVEENEDSDAEDEYGRNLKNPLTDAYRQEMLALERKLNAKSLHNIGPDPKHLPKDAQSQLDRQKEKLPTLEMETQLPKTKKSKKVSFAAELDIAPDPDPVPRDRKLLNTVEKKPAPAFSNSVFERNIDSKAKIDLPERPVSEVSKFKAARSKPGLASSEDSEDTALPNITSPSRPPERIQSDLVVERSPSNLKSRSPTMDEVDASLHRKEIAGEYHRLRNRMIARQSGFMDEPEVAQETVWNDEPKKKVSRFKATRLQ